MIALFGIGLDVLPTASPGINIPQLMVVLAGIGLSVLACGLRRAGFRQDLLQHLALGLTISALTLLVLEALLAAAGYETYYVSELPAEFRDFTPWRTCDDAGCHFIRDVALANCSDSSTIRSCGLNPQGYADTQSFIADNSRPGGSGVLVLGDSFTFGMSSDIGKSFVETLESIDTERLYWNTAVPGAGTHHALASFKAYAPLLKPWVTLLGFYMNDFGNNMVSLSYWSAHEDPADDSVVVWHDLWGNAIRLDQRSTFFFLKSGIDPPASEFERHLGTTRLGSLLLRFLDSVARIKSDAEGMSSKRIHTTRSYLRQLRDAAAEEGTTLLVLLIPRQSDLGSPSALYLNAVRLLEELEIAVLNPIGSLDAQRDYAADGHWNNAGHRKIAMSLSNCLENFRENGGPDLCGR